MTAMSFGFLIFLGIVLLAIAGGGIGAFNALVGLNKQVQRAWANIDVILKQRHDVIPQLISVCEQFTQYERGTLDHVIEARKKYTEATSRDQQIQADQQMSAAITKIFAVGEAYPVLKSSEQFVQIQNMLASLEAQLADRREFYNEAVTNFNTRIEQVPAVFFAGTLGFKHLELYKIEETDKAMPSLNMKMPA